MNQHGIFINYRRKSGRYMAGRIYDYLKSRGFDPFLDVYSLHQGRYHTDLRNVIEAIPYFLCVLSAGCMEDLGSPEDGKTYCHEIEIALESGCEILLVKDYDFVFPDTLPETLKPLLDLNYYTIDKDMGNFYDRMDALCTHDIDLKKLEHVLNWREYASYNANVFVASRSELENGLASLSNRFGNDMIESIKGGTPFSGEYRIKHINMSCYAASIIFAPERHMVDHQAYDYGMMFNIFTALLRDDGFSLTLITNSPDSPPADDAIETAKLGNSSLEENQRAVFLSSYANIRRLVQDEPYKSAKKNKRFNYLITDTVLPFAYFQVIYKEPWAEFNHIKIDLYTEGLGSNSKRRSMLFFERDHVDTYLFLQNQFMHLQERTSKRSRELIREGHDRWMREWDEFLQEN